jgi:hypothetical protein
VTELSKLGIKLFATDGAAVRAKDFVPIFHSWIQKQSVENHQLIDVHDYSHIHHGPGILLVAHEGNFSTDMADGKPGLAYFRKQTAGSTEETLRASLKSVLEAATLLEKEPSLKGSVRFRRDELLVVANDRLRAPNSSAGLESIRSILARVFGPQAGFTHANAGSNERLAVRVSL